MLKSVEEWHRRLGREVQGGDFQGKKSPIRDRTDVEGTEESHNMKVWRIAELLSSQELIAEGRRLHHCVATFAQSCHGGVCSIWSMSVETDEKVRPILTIEVHNDRKEVRQVRGASNRHTRERELDALKHWSLQEGLTVLSYL